MNRAPSHIWIARPLGTYPNGYVRTEDNDLIRVAYAVSPGVVQTVLLPRKDARLLAKRINECLDGTVRK